MACAGRQDTRIFSNVLAYHNMFTPPVNYPSASMNAERRRVEVARSRPCTTCLVLNQAGHRGVVHA
eukprot:11158069-Lingulodinium_polyedra.AAC.1